jgi:uncharacterized protein YjbI with pentapeptide repeats
MGVKKRSFKQEPSSKNRSWWQRFRRWTGYRGKTLWDWQAILFVPVSIALIASLIALYQAVRQQEIENNRAQSALEIEEQRAQDTALQAYFDQMSNLLLDEHLRTSDADSEVRTLARARTLTILERVNPDRKAEVMQFSVEAVLIQSVGGKNPIIGLSGADLHNIDLRPSGAGQNDNNPFDIASGLEEFDGQRALLIGIDLHGADLAGANLEGASLPGANLREASLYYTDLRRADLSNADLSNANLRGADLNNADLSIASLSGADLSNADLTNARGINNKDLEQEADSLAFATMPNGQKYEDWRKTKNEY